MFLCPYCKKSYKDFGSLKSHAKKIHKLTQFCPVCNRKFKSIMSHLAREARQCTEHAKLYVLHCDRRSRQRKIDERFLKLLEVV